METFVISSHYMLDKSDGSPVVVLLMWEIKTLKQNAFLK